MHRLVILCVAAGIAGLHALATTAAPVPVTTIVASAGAPPARVTGGRVLGRISPGPILRSRNGLLDAYWSDRLADRIRSVPTQIGKGKALYAGPLGRWADRYHGGAPVGLIMAHIQMETGGDVDNTGDPGLGEAGAMSVTSSFPPTVGLPATARLVPEVNIFLGCLELQINAIKLAQKIGELEIGSADNWKMAHLAFVIGYGGVLTNVTAAKAAGYIRAGRVYDGLCDWVRARSGLGVQAGSQDPGKVGYRILVIAVRWEVAQGIVPGGGNVPRLPPQPPGYTYQIPYALLPYFNLAPQSSILAWVALAAAGIYLVKRFR